MSWARSIRPLHACGRVGRTRAAACRGLIDRARLDERSNVESINAQAYYPD
ncbi:MAG TPA: hypothetical protein VKU38_01350 [Ktedonobacteraceae bacterium]|nr:hypothetical protein [Ktedonobacteraceae bacterium]